MTLSPLSQHARAWIAMLRASLGDATPTEKAEDGHPDLMNHAGALAGSLPIEPEPDVPAQKRAGQIWVAHPDDRMAGVSALVLLTLVDKESARGVIASEQLWLAASDDVLLPADALSCGCAMVACLWRDVPVDLAALAEYVGDVERTAFDAIAMLLQHSLTRGFRREPLGRVEARDIAGADDAGRWLLRWQIASPANTRREYITGPRIISDDDPRAEAREVFYLATQHVEERALRRLEAMEVEVEDAREATRAPRNVPVLASIRRALERWGAEIADAAAVPAPALAYRGTGLAAGVAALPGIGSLVAGLSDKLRPTEARGQEPAAFAALVTLGSVKVELAIEVDEAWLGISGVAFAADGERPIAGVSATVRLEQPNGEVMEWVRTTEAAEGDFGRITIPVVAGARCSLRLTYDDLDARVEW